MLLLMLWRYAGLHLVLLSGKSLLFISSYSSTTISEQRVKKKNKFSMKIKNNKNDNISMSGDSGGGTGSALNPLQTDVSVVENFFLQGHEFWDGPL